MAAERYGILHGELRAGADGEMRRVGGVSDQHDLAMVPALAEHAVEVQPRGAAQVSGIALQAVAIQITAEELLAEGDRLFRVEAVESMRLPCLFPRLDDHGREVLAELVRVDLEPAVFRPFEGK